MSLPIYRRFCWRAASRFGLLIAVASLLFLIPTTAHATIDTLYTYSFDFSINAPPGPVVDAVITVGDTLRWVRLDGNHTTTSVAGSLEQWDAPLNGTTPTFDHQFTHLGTFWFYCKPHGFDNGDGTSGGMSGTVTVLPAGEGACCVPSGCEFVSAAACQLQGGTFQGVGVPCTPEPCPNAPVTMTLTAAKDNTLYEDATGSKSNGAGQYLYTGNQNSGLKRRGVVAFDLGGIPSTAYIQSATLSLYCNSAAGSTIGMALHRLTATWGEGTSVGSGNEGTGGAATTGDATWLHRFYSTTFWASPGGDFVATPSATLSVPAVASATYQWSGAGLISDVQSWVGGTAANSGWVIRGDEASSANVRRFASREASTASQRPTLQITFLSSTPAGACCLPDGTCDSITAAQCAAAGGTYQGDNTSCAGRYCPLVLTMYADPLPRPVVATPTSGTAGGTASYSLSVTQIKQKLHRDLPATTLWGYGGGYPGPTIEATTGNPITVTWHNDLRDSTGALLTRHFLPVDPCMHGPDMSGPTARTVVHLHGGHVGPESDGYPEQTILPGESQTFHYPNIQPATTLWYHDHALGITRLNVIMGLAGFYLIRDAAEAALNLPANSYEVPIVIQDRTLRSDGSISYPTAWKEMVFGDKAVVNGKVWPYLNVNQGKYRFRLLNGSNSRVYTLQLSNGAPIVQIGSDGGLLAAPASRNSLTIAPGERADVIVDFAPYAPGTEILLRNSAPAPFPNADPLVPILTEIMKFVVQPVPGYTLPIPAILSSVPRTPEADAVQSRDFMLARSPAPAPCGGQFWTINGKQWDDVTEFPVLGTTEIWRFINMSEVTHPMHIHLVRFQILDRQQFTMLGDSIALIGSPTPPAPYEAGWKDTAPVNPNEVVRVIARFEDFTGRYPYHCHILEHEDHEMMRQFQVVSAPVTAVAEETPRYQLALHGARPNPFNPRTKLEFELPRRAHVRLDVFDVSGRVVATLVNGTRQAGPGSADWDGTDRAGNPVASGLYFYRLSVEGSRQISHKMVLMK